MGGLRSSNGMGCHDERQLVLSLLQGYEEGNRNGLQYIDRHDMIELQSMGVDLVVLDSHNIPRTHIDLVPNLAKIYTILWGSLFGVEMAVKFGGQKTGQVHLK